MSTIKNEEIPQMAKIVERNVNALLHRKKEDNKKRSIREKVIDSITAFAGSLVSVYFHCTFFGIWVIWNLGLLNLKPFDADFIKLATFAGVEAIFLSTFILIGQKRINVLTDKWAELDLQISLLTEHEVTRIMSLVTAIAKKMEIREAHDQEIVELSKDIHPEKVLDTMENAAE